MGTLKFRGRRNPKGGLLQIQNRPPFRFQRPSLQMKYTSFNFFCFSDVPEIFSKISASSPGDVHFVLIFIMAIWTFPFKVIVDFNFSVKSADMAEIGRAHV